MKMKRSTAAILLVLSLEALVAGRLSAAIADDVVDTIRLPSHGLADELVTAARESGGKTKRPWKCCDVKRCNRKMPPGCRCMDPVERCDDACSRCEASTIDPSKRVCMDQYEGTDYGPSCTKPGNGVGDGDGNNADDALNGLEVTGHESMVAATEEARPWKCCDDSLCTRSAPPTCFCRDKVKKCAKTCKVCEKADKSNGASASYVCRDSYFGWSPRCTKPVAADLSNNDDSLGGQPGVAGQEATATVVAAEGPRLLNSTGDVSTDKAEAVSEKSVADGEEDARPWKCCDVSWCTRSMPPICHCQDKVKKCAKTCKRCMKADGSNGASSSYVCRDTYGKPGPPCPKPVAAGVHRGN